MMINQIHKYLRERGFTCSVKEQDKLHFWKTTINKDKYWIFYISHIGDKIYITLKEESNIDNNYEIMILNAAIIDSIVELAVILKIFNLVNENKN